MTPEQAQEQHDKIIKMSVQIDAICAVMKKLPCEKNTDMLTRHDEKIKTLWLPFSVSVSAMVGVAFLFLKGMIKT